MLAAQLCVGWGGSCRYLFLSAARHGWRMQPRHEQLARVRSAQQQNQQKRLQRTDERHFHLQVVGNGRQGAPLALKLFSHSSSYLFNCSEGVQRISGEIRSRLTWLDGVLLTSCEWRAMGGLCGLLLTCSASGMSRVQVHSPPGLRTMMNSVSSFVNLKNVDVQLNSDPDSVILDRGLEIRKVPLRGAARDPPSAAFMEKTRLYSSVICPLDFNTFKSHKQQHQQQFGASQAIGETTEQFLDQHVTYAYLCTLPTIQANIDLRLCVDVGLPPGPPLGKLKAGESVTLEDGRVIHPSDVIPPSAPRVKVLVVDVPSLAYLDSLRQLLRSAWCHSDGSRGNDDSRLTIVAHMTPRHVFESLQYRRCLRHLSSSVRHLVLNGDCGGHTGIGPLKNGQILATCDNSLFPPLFDFGAADTSQEWPDVKAPAPTKIDVSSVDKNDVTTDKRDVSDEESRVATDSAAVVESCDDSDDKDDGDHNDDLVIIRPSCGWTLQLTPREIFTPSMPVLLPGEFSAPLLESAGVRAERARYLDNIAPAACSPPHLAAEDGQHRRRRRHTSSSSGHSSAGHGDEQADVYPQTVFLGTGSSVPNRKRNTSGILIRISASQSVLLDCGEATYSQLVCLYGPAVTADILRGLSVIFVSHMHADHHIGLITMLERRREALAMSLPRSQTLSGSSALACLLMAPLPICHVLHTYERVTGSPISDSYTLVDNETLLDGQFCARAVPCDAWLQLRLASCGVASVSTCPVVHCLLSYGVKLVLQVGGDGGSRAANSPPSQKQQQRSPRRRTIVYSGDTRPCPHLASMGMNCDLLIHEATYEDAMMQEAVMHSHCTVSEAIGVGVRMRARHVILTHFSQRYPMLPVLPDSARNSSNIGVAFDNMIVDFDKLSRLPHLLPLLETVFQPDLVTLQTLNKRKRQESV